MSGRDPLASADLAHLAALACTSAESQPDRSHRQHGLVVGELVALIDSGRVPLVVIDPLADTAAIVARSLIDLTRRHMGSAVAMLFENGDPTRPVIIGLLQGASEAVPEPLVGEVELEAGGARMVVTARETLVLRCGKSSITLAADGQIEIRGEGIVTQAARANRIRGGSVELN